MIRRTRFAFPVIIALLAAVVLLFAANPAPLVSAADPSAQEVPVDWDYIPAGLEPGDSFRLLFVTSNTRDGKSKNIADYNSFVQSAAAKNDLFKDFSGQFRALASVAGTHAIDNSGTRGTGVPIYWANGAKIANDYADFYDGSWASKAGTDENGNRLGIRTTIWTGTNSDGTEHASELGGTYNTAAYDSLGVRKPFGTSITSADDKKHIYALSPVLQVALGQAAAAPVAAKSDVTENRPATGAPTITGAAAGPPTVGQTLTADTSGISDPDGLASVAYLYRWLAGDSTIAGATSATYTVRAEDAGKTIKVQVFFTDDAGNRETLTSKPTAAVVAGGL